jgi:hypothetical protein
MPRAAVRSRKQKPLPESLHRDLSLYALAAGAAGVSALALAQPAEAQIVYTPADETIQFHGTIPIDLDHDGVTDLTIVDRPWAYGTNHYPGNSVRAVARAGAGIGRSPYQADFAADLLRGTSIGPSDQFDDRAIMFRAVDPGGTYYSGSWGDAMNRYLGIRFQIGGEIHYGWARLDVGLEWRRIKVRLRGYAYETQPNKAIRAGDTGQDDSGDDPSSNMLVPMQPVTTEQPTLGALALGATGTSVWRSDQAQ